MDLEKIEHRAGRGRWLTAYLVLTFGITWGLGSLFIFAPEFVESTFGPAGLGNPIFILAVYSPAISVLIVVGVTGGRAGLAAFLGRILQWRVGLIWYALVFLIAPVCTGIGAVFHRVIAGGWPAAPDEGFGSLLAALGFMLVLGPLEELGWRGYMLPVLQRRVAPLTAAIIVGIVWGIWHLPSFFVSGLPQGAWAVFPFLLAIVCVSVVFTGIFNGSCGSLLLAMLFHWQLNNPFWPDIQPYDAPAFALGAAAIFALLRRPAFRRESAHTTVFS